MFELFFIGDKYPCTEYAIIRNKNYKEYSPKRITNQLIDYLRTQITHQRRQKKITQTGSQKPYLFY
ncbi:hypothetical protein NBRC116591_04610 [Sessilibacter corallicola]|uniref:Uncharacterized protein n=1 Tax=Sessilibacter corallicola TaxID=2904075 RepID=A0ABQ0A4S5_9GAMM